MKKKLIVTEVLFDEVHEKIFRVIDPSDGSTFKLFYDEPTYLAFISGFEGSDVKD